MKRIVVRLSGMPFDPTYEIDDDTPSATWSECQAAIQLSSKTGRLERSSR